MSTTAVVFDVTRKISGSRQLKELSYSTQSEILRATFTSGDVYDYFAVPETVAAVGLVAACGDNFSIGSWFHKAVKGGGYKYERVAKSLEPDFSVDNLTPEEYRAVIAQRVRS